MTGLEKIVDIIKTDGKQAADQISLEGQKIANEMLDQAKKEIELKRQSFEAETKKTVDLLKEKGISSAQSKKNTIILEEKQNLISKTIEMAKNKIRNLDDNSYFSKLEDIIVKFAHKEDGSISLSERDQNRLPSGFMENVNQKLKNNAKGTLTIETAKERPKDGVILFYADIQENCSLDSLFEQKKEELEDMINSSLFVS